MTAQEDHGQDARRAMTPLLFPPAIAGGKVKKENL